MQVIEQEYIYCTVGESIIQKDWAAGSAKPVESQEFLIKHDPLASPAYFAEYSTVSYPPALFKIFDEPIVNALDHLVKCLETTKQVKQIKVSLDKTGRFRIYNTGRGIPVVIHNEASKHEGSTIYLPTMLFGLPFQGGNHKKVDSITGGTNGLGAKLSNCFSTEFEIETSDGTKFFRQKFENHMTTRANPTILDTTDKRLNAIQRAEHTTVSFIPDYKGIFGYDGYSEDLHQLMTDILRTRVFMAAAYAKYTCSKHYTCDIFFNDEKLTGITGIADIAKICFPTQKIVKTTITGDKPPYNYTWEVCAVITNSGGYKYRQMSNVNGVVVRAGKHYDKIINCIKEGVAEKIKKIFKDRSINYQPSFVTNGVFLFMNTKIPNAGWTGQRKDELDINIRLLTSYVLDNKFINGITEDLEKQVVDTLFDKKVKKKTSPDIDDPEKYRPSQKTGPKSQLWLFEGDSAFNQAKSGLTPDYYALFSLGGVPMNVRKQIDVHVDNNGRRRFIMSKKLTNNKTFNNLITVLGLDLTATYEKSSPTYAAEMSRLRYGKVIACVDQDLDGKGNILGLVLSMFDILWPALIADGYIGWFISPIVRVYPKSAGSVLEFYDIPTFEEWVSTANLSKYESPCYYKGFGSHSPEENKNMFKKINLRYFYNDEEGRRLFEIYYGKIPDLRKEKLSLAPTALPPEISEHQRKTGRISTSNHLEIDVDEYQRDNLDRKLDHAIDGQNQAGRKILDGLLKKFAKKNKAYKVNELAGYIMEKEHYTHGESSMFKGISNRGFVAIGGKQLPIIIPKSNFGTRLEGGNDAASPRYIWCVLNSRITDLLFPKVDYGLLKFNMDDGKRAEPKYFVPIIPMALIESTELPSHGWKYKTWGRDVFSVINAVRKLILIGESAVFLPLPPARLTGSAFEWKGSIRYYGGRPYSMGKYSVIGSDTIIITELPLRVWTVPYLAKLKKKKLAENTMIISVDDMGCNETKVCIRVTLTPGSVSYLESFGNGVFNGLEHYLGLADHMVKHLNLMMPGDVVREFTSYEEILYPWFSERRQLYVARVQREKILMRMDEIRLINIIKYCNAGIKIKGRKRSEVEADLESGGYQKMNVGLISNPKFVSVDKMEELVMRGPKSTYNYLLNLRDFQKTEEGQVEFTADLEKLREKMEQYDIITSLGAFPGAKLWESELDLLEANVKEGFRTSWQFEKFKKYKFD